MFLKSKAALTKNNLDRCNITNMYKAHKVTQINHTLRKYLPNLKQGKAKFFGQVFVKCCTSLLIL